MLVDVHTALDLAAPDDAGDTERVFVTGSYEYYHYGQVRCRPESGLCAARCFRDTAGRARSEISQTISRTCSRVSLLADRIGILTHRFD